MKILNIICGINPQGVVSATEDNREENGSGLHSFKKEERPVSRRTFG